MSIVHTTRFKNDVSRIKRRGYDMQKLRQIIIKLHDKKKLNRKHKDHKLRGKLRGCRECRVDIDNDDWLLIYWHKDLDLILERTGTHNDLFKKTKLRQIEGILRYVNKCLFISGFVILSSFYFLSIG